VTVWTTTSTTRSILMVDQVTAASPTGRCGRLRLVPVTLPRWFSLSSPYTGRPSPCDRRRGWRRAGARHSRDGPSLKHDPVDDTSWSPRPPWAPLA
jgi:hypothetical protein